MLEAVVRPQSAAAALSALAGRNSAVLAGGTLVMPAVNAGTSGLKTLVSLDRSGLAAIRVSGGKAVIGAMATLAALEAEERLSVLRPALRSIGSPVLRQSATVGGNLFAPAPYGDFATVLLALDATVTVEGREGARTTPIEEWLSARHRPGEIVTELRFAVPTPDQLRFRKAMRRAHNSAAIVTVAARVDLAGDTVRRAVIALGGVAARPVRPRSAEAALKGQRLDPDTLRKAGEAARADIRPADDAYASAWYRRQVLPVHFARAFLPE